MKNWLQKTWGRILLLAMLVLLLALTTRWWLLPVLNLLDANSDRLQSLDSIVSLLLVIGGLVLGFLGLRRRNEEKEVAPVTQIEGGVEAENGAVVTIGSGDKTTQPIATSGGVAAGQIAFRVEGGDVIFVADPDVLWHSLGRKRPAPDLAADTKTYLAHIVTLYRYLDFRGMGMSDRVALKLSLLDMYVPLKARVERP